MHRPLHLVTLAKAVSVRMVWMGLLEAPVLQLVQQARREDLCGPQA
jgi:hypothetical protein